MMMTKRKIGLAPAKAPEKNETALLYGEELDSAGIFSKLARLAPEK